jgi:hypothetical protein
MSSKTLIRLFSLLSSQRKEIIKKDQEIALAKTATLI